MENAMELEVPEQQQPPVDFVQLGPDVVFAICQFLTRADCIRLSRCSKDMHQLLEKCCYLRLTQKQAAIVDKILKMDNKLWQAKRESSVQVGNAKWTFPREHLISTGTSTGKTAITLVAASCLVRQGKPCLILAEDRLIPQWRQEWQKFERDLGLMPLIVPRSRQDPPLDFTPASRAIVLIPKRWMESKQITKPLIRWALAVRWHAIFCDELKTVPYFIHHHTSAFGITLNASAAGDRAAIADHAADEELGQLPMLDAHCYIVEKFNTPYGFGNSVPCERYQATYSYWTKLCSEGHNKTLIISQDCLERPWSKGTRNAWTTVTATEYVHLEGTTHQFTGNMNPAAKGNVITDFCAAQKAQAFLPASYVARGFNIPCDSLVIFDLNGSLSANMLLQLIGRVRRVQTSVRNVQVTLITGNPNRWKVFASLHRKTTSQILQSAQHMDSVDAFRALGLDIHADYLPQQAQQHIWLEVRPGETPVAPENSVYGNLEVPKRIQLAGYTEHAIFGDYSAALYKKSASAGKKYWRLAIVQCTHTDGRIRPTAYRLYKEKPGGCKSTKAFENFQEAVDRFCLHFMKTTGNAWEGRANFCIHPDKFVFVSYNVNAVLTEPLPKLGLTPTNILPVATSRHRDASPKRH